MSDFIKKFNENKKQNTIALSLVIIMALVWIKTLVNNGSGPDQAKASLTQAQITDQELATDTIKVSKAVVVELPVVVGRNDVLSRNFFGISNKSSSGEVDFFSNESSEGIVRRIANLLKLEAIGLGQKPEAFINNKLVNEGDELFVFDDDKKYKCKIVKIKENVVLVLFENSEIKLKLIESIRNSK